MVSLPSLPFRPARPRRELFTNINHTARGLLPAILARLLPGGRLVGGEYVVRNPTRLDRTPGSFKVRVRGRRAGAWADFATGEQGGDMISLVAYLDGVSQWEAAKRLARLLNINED